MQKYEIEAELQHARRVIAQLEKALLFVKAAKPHEMYPGEEFPVAHALGAAQGEAIMALCSIPPKWRAVASDAGKVTEDPRNKPQPMTGDSPSLIFMPLNNSEASV